MIVVDSSVFIAGLKGISTPATRFMYALQAEGELIVPDLVALEVLQGMPNERQAAHLEETLLFHGITPILNEEIALSAAKNYRALRRRGITVRKTPDMIIATFCMAHGHHLLHQDRDFDHFEQFLGLKVYRPY
jgi:predicted nucleic acid-binding protein